ncbi:hypothetical protein J4433_00170 [Candidatus Pacearchaeota archaeon]|nr:hypothetical protein [Candidatus Pacearchaeota archaeon]
MTKKNPLRGEERKIVSTRVYRSEFANFIKICQTENKTVNTKLREMIREEIEKNPESFNKNILIKKKEDEEMAEEKIRLKQKEWNFKINRKKDNV